MLTAMHALDDIESILNFFEDDDASGTLEEFAGGQLDIPPDGPLHEFNWTPEENHLFLGFLEPSSVDEWMHREEELVSFGGLEQSSNSVDDGERRDGNNKRKGERCVHGKSRSKRIRRVWPSQALPVRKCCSHCKAEKTPQWRIGPMGPKTLCNACGVRYKSGRLVPEYRPAASPTFVGHLHSNSHRKIMRMREERKLG